MRIEEAIERLENHTQYCVPVDDLDAFEMAVTALRAQQTPLDRSRWPGCDNCTAGDGEFRQLLEKWGDGDYCSRCGRPLTEQAWAELERRLNGGTADR